MSIKLLNPVRQMARLGSSTSMSLRAFSTTGLSQSKHLRVWRPFDDTFFNMASRVMRNLEREFDWVSRQASPRLNGQWFPAIERSMQENLNNDLIVTDKDGNRKFQLVLELSDFQPEEIKIKTEGHTLNISAKKESQVRD